MNKKEDAETEKIIEKNMQVNEKLIEMKKSNTDADFGFLLSLLDFLTWT